MRLLARFALATGAVLLLGLGTAAPAQACPPTVCAPPGQNPSYDEPFPDAPTSAIRKLAKNISVTHKSVSTLVTLPPGLDVGTMEVSILFASKSTSQRITQSYVNGTGNRWLYNFHSEDGVKRANDIFIRIQQGADVYNIHVQPNIEPLYDISYGPLRIEDTGSCDVGGSAELTIIFENAVYSPQKVRYYPYGNNDVVVHGFAGTVREIGSSAARRMHNIGWREEDHWPVVPDFDPPIELQPGPLLLPRKFAGNPAHVSFQLNDVGSSCYAVFSYDITYQLRTYPYL